MNRSTFRRATARIISVGLAAVAAGLIALPATPAEAFPCFSDYDSENEMRQADPDCRATFLVDPGENELMSRDDLLRHKQLYLGRGWSENFLWYSHAETATYGPELWTYCNRNAPRPGEACAPDAVVHPGAPVRDTFFGRSVELSVFRFGDAFIARVCGNDSVGRRATPVPAIAGVKFYDRDRDGVQDADEAGLAGWTFVVTRVRSDAGQEEGHVADVVSGPDGRYRFDLLGHGPGAYTIHEVRQDGFMQTTPAVRTVEVHAGIGDATLDEGTDFGNVESRADVAKVDMTVEGMPDTLDAGRAVPVIVRAAVTNRGPTSPVEVDDTLDVTAPGDCVVTPSRRTERRTLNAGETVVIEFPVTLQCSRPSFHDFVFRNDLSVVTPGVEDPAPEDNSRTVSVRRPVLAYSDFEVDALDLACERVATGSESFACTSDTSVSNGGPFGPAEADVRVALSGAADCAIGAPQTTRLLLGAATTTVVRNTWPVSCTAATPHVFRVTSSVTPVDEHVLDGDGGERSLALLAIDVKPHSDPNSLNIDRAGLVAVAVLSSGEFDALARVDTGSLRFGATGTEDSLASCKTTGEDVNADGFADLVCHFRVADTGFTCSTTTAVLRGVLGDGTPFVARDAVRIVPCR